MAAPTMTFQTPQTFADGEVVTIGGRTFMIEFSTEDPSMVWMKGMRGGTFFLRPFLGPNNGQHQIVSWGTTTGALRNKAGKTIIAFVVGDLITDFTSK